MSQLGMGYLMNWLGGDAETPEAVSKAIEKKILAVSIADQVLTIEFEGGGKLNLKDEAQSCCEYRHMSTDDDLSYYVGATLLDMTVEDGPQADEGYDVHDQQFLHVKTSKGSFTVVNHNEHNGYYGGFWITAKFVE